MSSFDESAIDQLLRDATAHGDLPDGARTVCRFASTACGRTTTATVAIVPVLSRGTPCRFLLRPAAAGPRIGLNFSSDAQGPRR